MSGFDRMVEIARRKLGGDPGLKWVSAKAVTGGFLIEMGKPTRTYAKGPRKGKDDWRKVETKQAIVTKEETEATELAYEAEGKCSNCDGEGRESAGWSAAEGTKWRECRRCKGTGKASQ